MTGAAPPASGFRAKLRDRFGIVLACIFATYVSAFLIDHEGAGAVVLAIVVSAAALIALATTRIGARWIGGAIGVAVVAVGMTAVGVAVDERASPGVAAALLALLLAFAAMVVLRDVLLSPKVSSGSIVGAISVYAALGIVFTAAYWAVDRLEPGPFFEQTDLPTASDFIFFSYTTLTTTGYGDLSPAGDAGRMVSGIEMMTGQVFLVTLVAGLVALWRPGERLAMRRGRREAD